MKKLLGKLCVKFLSGAALQLGMMITRDVYMKEVHNKKPQTIKSKKKDPIGFSKETASY